MARFVWWFLKGIIYSAVIFAFMYYFIYLGAIPNLGGRYTQIFTLNVVIIVSIICGFFFSAIITFVTGNRRNKIRR